MTPADEAYELIQEFYPNVQWKLGQEDCLKIAKQCALITVNRLIKETGSKYWYNVKKEIEKL